jgi:hypothetical protein
MEDSEIHRRIEMLVAEEHELWKREAENPGLLHEHDRRRLDDLKVMLDQCWDLLRQRHALEEFGLDAATARVRDPDTVEHYRQ